VSREIPFDEIALDEPLGPVEVVASEKAVRRYCDDWDDHNPIYLERSPSGGPLVPPAFMAGLTGFQLLATRYDARATIGARTDHENIHPARVGSKLITSGSIVQKYVRRRLEYVVIESRTCDQDGLEIRRSRDHILLGIERRKGSSRDPTPGRRSRALSPRGRIGEEIPPLGKIAYQRALDERSFSGTSIHNDEYTRRQGYAGALMSAYVLCGYMSELLVNFFGADWLRGGRLSLTFIGGGVQQRDEVTCRGAIVRTTREAEDTRHELEIWMEKGSGTRVIAGEASGWVRAAASSATGEQE
jgi:hypothetical protein